jgi:RNA polymerase sigma factor (sigma-70 family)
VKPLLAATATEAPDEQLVAAARDGSDVAFEALFLRYRSRVVGYVRGMVSDHGRAEDIVQEAFISALRALRSSDQDIAFRPWIHEIAKNACIDHMRRARRAQEVSIDSEDFGAQDEGRLSESVAQTEVAVAGRAELESLRMAFGDLPESQHQILVMREFEGLSYDKIGSRMGLSHGAVESLLFRARRRLRDGFEEIDTGERCMSMRAAMEAIADGNGRARERRRLLSHLGDCKPCRRAAVAMGLDSLALGAEQGRGRRVGALLPLPAFLRRWLGDGSAGLGGAQAGVEQGATLAAKVTAVVVAAALAAGGAGVAQKAAGHKLPLLGGSATGGGGSGDGTGSKAGRDGGVPRGPGGPAGSSGEGGGSGAGRGGSGTSSPGGNSGADATPGDLGRTLGSAPDAGKTAGSLGGVSPTNEVERLAGGDVNGVVNGVNDTIKKTTDAVGLPETEVRLPTVGSSDSGGGSVTLPEQKVQLPGVQTPVAPSVSVPRLSVTVPSTTVQTPQLKLTP